MSFDSIRVIGKSGRVEGNVFTQKAYIAGKIVGDVSASEYLELLDNAKIEGSIECMEIKKADGAIIAGSISQFGINY